MSSQKVSIIVPVYNCENTIEKCLLSLINQTYENKEIIVVDDCSTDNTREILRRMTEKYDIKVIRLPRNSGAGAARNKGIRHATGDIIFVGEADAYYEPNYIELCIRHLVENPRVGTVIGALHAWPENSLWYKWWEAMLRIILFNYRAHNGWFFRRTDLEKIGFYREDLKVGEDRELVIRLKKKLSLEWAYEPNALWYHKFPYSLRKILIKAFEEGKNIIKFNKIIGIHRKTFFRSIIYLVIVLLLAGFTIFGVISSNWFYIIFPALFILLGFIYPIYQLKSRKIGIKEFKEYVILFPFVRGLVTLFFFVGYLFGCVTMKEHVTEDFPFSDKIPLKDYYEKVALSRYKWIAKIDLLE